MPEADEKEAKEEYGITLENMENIKDADCIVLLLLFHLLLDQQL